MRDIISYKKIEDAMPLTRKVHPLDVVEMLSELHHVEFHRPLDDEIYFMFHSNGIFFEESLQWFNSIETLSYTCSFPIELPENRRGEFIDLISRLNAHLLTGHFDYFAESDQITFRYGLMLQGGVELSNKQCETLLNMGPKICLRYLNTFEMVAQNEINARLAMQLTLFDTVGEA